MRDVERLIARIEKGDTRNIRFRDLCRLLEAYGFEQDRITGSHHVYRHRSLAVRLVVQPTKTNDAKPYQLRQAVAAVKGYALQVEER